jgi:hypothetical protein
MEIVGEMFSHNSCSCKRPHITVPCGIYNRLSFFGTAYSEPELIGLAYAFEQASITELNLVSKSFIETPSNKTL